MPLPGCPTHLHWRCNDALLCSPIPAPLQALATNAPAYVVTAAAPVAAQAVEMMTASYNTCVGWLSASWGFATFLGVKMSSAPTYCWHVLGTAVVLVLVWTGFVREAANKVSFVLPTTCCESVRGPAQV